MTEPLRILQITDTHLYASPDGQLLGLNTLTCLEKIIDLALQTPKPDLVVATGDLAHDGSPEAYAHVRDCFARLDAPVCCLPGNHDEAAMLKSQLDTPPFRTAHELLQDRWQLLFLDSTVPGSEGGHLGEEELSRLDEALGAGARPHSMIFVHHQPVLIGSAWLDTMAIDNPKELFAVIDRYPQVRAIVWGHVHQEFEQQRNGVRLLATPSTCLQFLPGSDAFSVDLVPPGYRWLELYDDGRIETGIARLQHIPGTVDMLSLGY